MGQYQKGIEVFSDPVSPLQEFSKSPLANSFPFYLDDAGVVLVMEMVLLGGLNHMVIPNIPFVSVDKSRIAFSVSPGTLATPGKIEITSQVVELPKKRFGRPNHVGELSYEMENGGPCGIRLAKGSLITAGRVNLLHGQIEKNLGNTSLLMQITNESGFSPTRRVKNMLMEIVASKQNLLLVHLS